MTTRRNLRRMQDLRTLQRAGVLTHDETIELRELLLARYQYLRDRLRLSCLTTSSPGSHPPPNRAARRRE